MKTISVGVSTIFEIAAAVSALSSPEREADVAASSRSGAVVFTTSGFFISEISLFVRCEIISCEIVKFDAPHQVK